MCSCTRVGLRVRYFRACKMLYRFWARFRPPGVKFRPMACVSALWPQSAPYLWVLVAPKSGLKSGGKSGHPTLFCQTILDPILQLNPVSKFGSKIGWGLLRSFERGTRGRSRAAGVAGASQTPTSYAKNLLETVRFVDPFKNIAPLAVMITT